jgi:hypothetical protein
MLLNWVRVWVLQAAVAQSYRLQQWFPNCAPRRNIPPVLLITIYLFNNIVTRLSVTVDGVLDCQLDLLDYRLQLQLQRITMYTLYNTSVELYTRLATAPQPAFHYNTLLASVAINSSILLRSLKLQRTNELTNWTLQLQLELSELTNSLGTLSELNWTLDTDSTPRYITSGRTEEKTMLSALIV